MGADVHAYRHFAPVPGAANLFQSGLQNNLYSKTVLGIFFIRNPIIDKLWLADTVD